MRLDPTPAPDSICLSGHTLTCARTRAFFHHRVVADHAPLFQHHARLEGALPPDKRPMKLGTLADIGIAPDDRAVDDRADVHRNVVAQHGRADDPRVRTDLHALAEEDGAGDARRFVDFDGSLGPNTRHALMNDGSDAELAVQ